MAEYEFNGDLWFYQGHEYRRGDAVTISDDLGDDHKAFVASLVETGRLVEPGHAEKVRKDAEKADAALAEREAEQVEHNDREAHRRVERNEVRIHGPQAEAPKPGPRRASSSK